MEMEEEINKVEKNVGVNVGVNAILALIEENPGINSKENPSNVDVTQRTIERWIGQLRDKQNR